MRLCVSLVLHYITTSILIERTLYILPCIKTDMSYAGITNQERKIPDYINNVNVTLVFSRGN